MATALVPETTNRENERAYITGIGRNCCLDAAHANASDNSQPAAKKSVDPQQKVICKTEDFVGSLIPRRICKTKADWEQGAIDAKAALDQKRLTDNPVNLCGKCGG